jgi:hypothetical protein
MSLIGLSKSKKVMNLEKQEIKRISRNFNTSDHLFFDFLFIHVLMYFLSQEASVSNVFAISYTGLSSE